MISCKVSGCNDAAKVKGFCRFHYGRYMANVPLNRPKGVRGHLNPNWNGGVSEYPNHYQMKKARKDILEEANYICYYCGQKATQVHHKDLSKNNHSKDNLVPCCHKCNHQSHRRKKSTSKYRRMYGKTLKELSVDNGVCHTTIKKIHEMGLLNSIGFPITPLRDVKYNHENKNSKKVDKNRIEAIAIRDQLNQIMTTRGISQSGLARLIGKSRQWISQLINGDHGITIATIKQLEKALNIKFERSV